MLFAYIGPDTMLPLASVVAGVLGVVMMLSRRLVNTCRKGLRISQTRSIGK